jgi:hypothetical protein
MVLPMAAAGAAEEDNGRLMGEGDVAGILQGSGRSTGEERVTEHLEKILSRPGSVQLYQFVAVADGLCITPGKVVASGIITKAGDFGDGLSGPVQQEIRRAAALGDPDWRVVIAVRFAVGRYGFEDRIQVVAVGMEIIDALFVFHPEEDGDTASHPQREAKEVDDGVPLMAEDSAPGYLKVVS